MTPCSLPSSMLRAGKAGGLTAMLDASCARRRLKIRSEQRNGADLVKQRNRRGGQFLVSPGVTPDAAGKDPSRQAAGNILSEAAGNRIR